MLFSRPANEDEMALSACEIVSEMGDRRRHREVERSAEGAGDAEREESWEKIEGPNCSTTAFLSGAVVRVKIMTIT